MSENRTRDDPVERTVQLAGNTTFVVSLPKTWATEQGLESGSSMYLYPHDDRLVAASEPVPDRDRSVTIHAGDVDEDRLLRRVRSAYLRGHDRIVIADDLDQETRRTLTRTIDRFVGMAVETDTAGRVVATNVLDASDVSLPQMVVQLERLALELYDDGIEAVERDDGELADGVRERGTEVDRLAAFVSRGFHRGLEDVTEISRLETDRVAAFREYRIARELGRVADHATAFARVADRQSGPPAPTVADELGSAGREARSVVELAVAGDDGAAHEAAAAVRERTNRIDRRLCDRADDDAPRYGQVLARVRRTVENGVCIADASVDASIGDRRP